MLRENFARDLKQAFHFLTALRLDKQLAQLAEGTLVRPAALTSAERELLRDSFKVVKQFRDFLRRHYNFGMF